VALPDAFFALDGLFETLLHVLGDFGAFAVSIEREVARYLPFLAVTKLLMAATRAGLGRERAHALIQKHAVEVAGDLRSGKAAQNDLIERLGADAALPLSAAQLAELLGSPLSLVGAAGPQVARFVTRVESWVARYPEAAEYVPGRLL
jgi:adenylosuccinate lyase